MNASTVHRTVRHSVVAGTLLTLLATFGCGSDDTSAEDAAGSPSASGAANSAPAGGIDQEQLQAIQECLQAAGIDTPIPSGMPTDMPTDRPTDRQTDMPTDLPTDLPAGGGPGGQLNSPEVQAALEACGLELPSGGPSAPAS